MSYPLPRASQECWTKWYNHKVQYGALKNKTIVWAARELPCRIKSDQVKTCIGPQHVFILKEGNEFVYAIMDNMENLYKLPKKYYTSCFPGVQYSNVPKNNRCKVKLTKKKSVELPYIPEPFLEQKRSKSTRKRRRTESTHENIETIDFALQAPEWTVLQSEKVMMDNKDDIIHLVRSLVHYSDTNENFTLTNDFEGITLNDIKTNDTLRTKMKTIVTFVYYYCRNELGIFRERPPMSINDLQSWLSEESS